MGTMTYQLLDHSAGIASKNADTDWLATDITPAGYATVLRISVVLATSRAIKLVDDTNTVLLLNGGTALAATGLYTFDVPVIPTRTYNIQNVTGASVIDYLVIWEIDGDRA